MLLIENRYRSFIPELGIYTNVDPLHRFTARQYYGPQAFIYAAQRPLRDTDPFGLAPGPAPTDSAATAAGAYILYLMATQGTDREYCAWITSDSCGSQERDFHVEGWTAGPPLQGSSGPATCTMTSSAASSRDIWAMIHNHPSQSPVPSIPDRNGIRAAAGECIYILTAPVGPIGLGSLGLVSRWDPPWQSEAPSFQFFVPSL